MELMKVTKLQNHLECGAMYQQLPFWEGLKKTPIIKMEINLFMENIIQGGASRSRETENKTSKYFFFNRRIWFSEFIVVV